MNISYIPWALELGARIFTSCRVEKVVIEGGRAKSVRALTESGHEVEIIAGRGVFVAASTIQTPNILRRSGVRSPDLGEHFMCHPGVALAAVFDSPVRMDVGAAQGAESIHFRKTHRFKLETLSMPPELAAARFPGAGAELMKRLAQFPNVAVWAVQIRARAVGRVKMGWGGRDKIKYSLGEDDVRTSRVALGVIAKMMIDHGAREIWPGAHGLPPVAKDASIIKQLEEGPLDPRAYNFVATHLFGAARMGPDPRSSVVGLDFAVHGTEGLYVVDSSVFPSNIGVNPQHTIMAIARHAAVRVAAKPLAKVA
jgi:choline dehydrogenase-like flavoprotein